MLIDYTRWSEEFKIYRGINYYQVIASLDKLKQQISNKKSKRARQAFGEQIVQTWETAFELPAMGNIEALDNYLYANLLMLECKKAAVRVSRETWSGIESRMLLPVRN